MTFFPALYFAAAGHIALRRGLAPSQLEARKLRHLIQILHSSCLRAMEKGAALLHLQK
jgi:hypothetical protein